jgi:uncharacterized protein YfaS (alpha-2-macroglobulin family)
MLGASSSLVCSSHSPVQTPSSAGGLDGLLTRSVPASPGTLTFPPPDADRRPRSALPRGFGAAYGSTATLEVAEPALDTQRQFSITGQAVRLVFNQTMARGEGKVDKGKKAGSLLFPAPGAVRIKPEIPGAARWVDERTLEFTSTQPFEIDRPYDIEVSSVEAASGKKLDATWKATFTATPSFLVAGKELGYIPKPGAPRVIAVHPSEATSIGRAQTFSVLYDQPIELPLARKLIELETSARKAIPTTLDHPQGSSFQGVKVDPRYVVLVRAAAPLAFKQEITLTARDRSATGLGRTSSFTVADPFTDTAVSCGWSDNECGFEGGALKLRGRSIHVAFNNAIRTDDRALLSKVSVTPPVKNLSVRSIGWDEGRLQISGEFEASRTYHVAVAGLSDRFGEQQTRPVRFKVQTAPQSASVAMPEGLILLDEATTKRFSITTRNVTSAEIVAWPVPPGDAAAFQQALSKVRVRELPEESMPIRIPVAIAAAPDRSVDTFVDLSSRLTAGVSYVATVRPVALAEGAEVTSFPKGSEASRPPVAMLSPGSPKTLAVHAELLPNATLVHVARLSSGEPLAGATVRFGGEEATAAVSTDARGVALLRAPSDADSAVLQVHAADADLLFPISGEGVSAKQLFPGLTSGAEPGVLDRRAVVLTDRGIYRPGSTAWIKATVRKPEGAKLVSVPGAPLRVRVVGPTGDEMLSERAVANDMGSVATRFAVPADAKLGRYQLRVEDPDHPEPPLAGTMIQIAEFEAPRFAVDIDASTGELPVVGKPKTPPVTQLRATVRGRYLFGAPMDGASVHWTLKRGAAPFAAGPLGDALSFRRKATWFDEDREDKAWTRAGDAQLGPDGTVKVEHALELDPALGPQEFVLEADVSDTSFRHIAGRAAVVKHPAKRYAGLKLAKGWVGVGETFPVDLGVISAEGQAVTGATVTARLSRTEWKYVERRGAGGGLRWEWTSRRSEAGRCSVKSESNPVQCRLTAAQPGDYEVSAEVDGRRGGSTSFWAWREGDEETTPSPSRGRTLEIVADKPRYSPGDQAKILVKSPYPAATALLTIEQGALVDHREVKVSGGAAVFDIPLSASHAPYVHATVTLLPIGAKGEAVADYRIGAIRLPVALESSRLEVALRSDKATYEPGQEAEISVEVKDSGLPEAHAEVALAVVDEGILRLTNFHAVDPVPALRPGRALSFRLQDSRKGLAELFERSHVAGDGGGAGTSTIQSTRKDFVETALWRPDLRTDAAGRATVRFRLPDNLTQFRIMAVVLDNEGKGAASENDFTVRKPVMLVPVVPRFALTGDRFEAAAMLHNNTSEAIDAKVTLSTWVGDPRSRSPSGDRSTSITLSGHGKSRVAFPVTAGAPGEMVLGFAVSTGSSGKALDRVEARLRVSEPGIEEHPHLEGAFAHEQEIALTVPENVRSDAVGMVSVELGQHLWPELGQRLDYLLDYPHGCVEQTTSSTLPLLAARAILPRIGFTRMSDAELKVRIRVGLDRLASMRTESGGLAYWPGGNEPNVYGTAYAMRAVVLAKEAGIDPPRGLLEGMKGYLSEHLLVRSVEPEVQAAIAESLAALGELPQSAADALNEREGRSVFGHASLAIALHSLGGQEDRVQKLLDQVEASFDESGRLTVLPGHKDFYYYGSPTRTKAEAVMALSRLRPRSLLLPRLLKDLAEGTESYTTQATAYSLLGLAEHLKGTVSDGAAFRVTLDGAELKPTRDLGFGSRSFQIPLERVRGKKATLRLSTDSDVALGFIVNARWRRPLGSTGASGGSGSIAATSTDHGPEVHRVFTDAKGGPVDLAHVRAGDVLRVVVMLRLPTVHVARERLAYLAVTDRLPAGFEPIQPDLATVASVPEIRSDHPFAWLLRGYGNSASHVELHDDRVNIYYDRAWGDDVAASYLVRASTPGEFTLPPAAGELMYEGNSVGYSEAGKVTVQ